MTKETPNETALKTIEQEAEELFPLIHQRPDFLFTKLTEEKNKLQKIKRESYVMGREKTNAQTKEFIRQFYNSVKENQALKQEKEALFQNSQSQTETFNALMKKYLALEKDVGGLMKENERLKNIVQTHKKIKTYKMREHKFRAWDKDKKVFIPQDVFAVVTTDFKAFGIMIRDWENYKEGEYFYEHSQELIQFTGLHDKNGKEIYEGCIVKFRSHPDKQIFGWVEYLPNECRFCVLYYRDDFDRERNQISYYSFLHYNTLEIIGNIYENQDLIK